MADNNRVLPEDGDSPERKTQQKRPSVFWSVLHHKDIEDTGPHNYVHERDPLIHDGGARRSEVSYGLSSPAAPDENDRKPTSHAWNRIREMVQTQELLIHHFPDLDDNSPTNDLEAPKLPQKILMRWSDLQDYNYEYTLRECLVIFLVLLAIGVVGFSLLVDRWTILDSLYFTLVLLTTIGYGDMTPSSPVSKIFASLFALGGIVVLGLALGVVGSQLVQAEIAAAEKMKEKTSKAIEHSFTRKRVERMRMESSGSSTSLSSLDSAGSVTSHNGENNDLLAAILSVQQSEQSYGKKVRLCTKKVAQEYWSAIRMIWKLLPGVVPIFSGALIIAYLEGWPWYDAFYYTVVTATTIGLGDLHPTSELSKACAVIFIPFAVAAMGHILGVSTSSVELLILAIVLYHFSLVWHYSFTIISRQQCASFLVELRREEHDKKLWSCSMKMEDLQALDQDHDGGVDELEYIKYMLVAMKKVDAHLFDELHAQFKQLDINNDGVVTKRDLQLIAARKLRKVKYKLQLSDYKQKLRRQSQKSMMHSALDLMKSSRRLSAAKRKSADSRSCTVPI